MQKNRKSRASAKKALVFDVNDELDCLPAKVEAEVEAKKKRKKRIYLQRLRQYEREDEEREREMMEDRRRDEEILVMQWTREGVAVCVPSGATVGKKKSDEVKKHLTLLHSMESCTEKAAYLHTILTTVLRSEDKGNNITVSTADTQNAKETTENSTKEGRGTSDNSYKKSGKGRKKGGCVGEHEGRKVGEDQAKDKSTDDNKGVNLVREILARLHTPELQKVAKELAKYPTSVQL